MKIVSLLLAFISLLTANTTAVFETTLLEDVPSEYNTIVKEDEVEKYNMVNVTYFDYSNEDVSIVFPYVWSLDDSVINKWLNGMKYEECFFEEKNTPWEIKEEQYSLYLGEDDRKTYVLADGSWYLLEQSKWYKISDFTRPPEGKKLTMEKLIEICETDKSLSWTDFVEYESQSIGSGILVSAYYINEDYVFLVGSTGKDIVYMNLESLRDKTSIDVREESIRDFIK